MTQRIDEKHVYMIKTLFWNQTLYMLIRSFIHSFSDGLVQMQIFRQAGDFTSRCHEKFLNQPENVIIWDIPDSGLPGVSPPILYIHKSTHGHTPLVT